VELKTTEQRVAYLVQQVPATQSNYKLLLLLYWQVFDGVTIPREVVNDILEKGTEPESIGRLKRKAITINTNPDEIMQRLTAALNHEIGDQDERTDQSKD
jgi:hypothetical protein